MPEEFNLEFPDSSPETSQESQPLNVPDEPFESVAQGFLKNVAEQDRAIVEKYVKDWDSGVTKRFQKLHETYQPYKNLGDIEEIQSAMQLHALLNDNPREFHKRMAHALEVLQEQGLLDMEDEYTGEELDETPQPQSQQQYNNDPELTSRLEQLEAMIEQLSGNFEQEQSQRQEQAQMQQLEEYMDGLHNKHGAFDDDYVLLMLSRGMDGDQAVAQFKQVFNGGLGANRPAPPKLFGNGGHPGQPEPNLSNRKDRLAYIADYARSQRD